MKPETTKIPKVISDSFYVDEQGIYELGFNSNSTYFIFHSFESKDSNYTHEILINDQMKLIPLKDDLILKRVIHLPSQPVPFGTEKDLYQMVRCFIHKYVGLSEFFEKLSAYYVLFTWLYDRFDTLPYLRVIGDYGTGKSRFLHTVGAISYKPAFASGATTVSPIFRIIDKYRGTLILDEADYKYSGADAEIIKILNCGYQKGFPVIRSELRKNEYEPIPYNVYCPKVIATRQRFSDKALESRCLTEVMDYNWRHDIPSILPENFWDEALALRNCLLQWRFNKYQNVHLKRDLVNESVEPRLIQVTMPIASIINDESMLSELQEFVARYNKRIVMERGISIEADILKAIINLGDQGNKSPSMKQIAERVNRDNETDETISYRRVGGIVSDSLKLEKQQHRHVTHLVYDDLKIKKLGEKYGEDERVGRSRIMPWDMIPDL
jgi:hypothetical protein